MIWLGESFFLWWTAGISPISCFCGPVEKWELSGKRIVPRESEGVNLFRRDNMDFGNVVVLLHRSRSRSISIHGGKYLLARREDSSASYKLCSGRMSIYLYKLVNGWLHRVFSLVQEEQFDPYHLCIIFTRSCSPCSSKQYWVLSAHTSARSDQTCWTKYFSCSCQTCLIKIDKILLILRDHMLWFESVGNTTFDRIYIGSNLFSPFFFFFS